MSAELSTFLLLTITGLGLGAMYFLIASGLSLIYGLMGVLNFAHGFFLTVGAYGTWWMENHLGAIGSVTPDRGTSLLIFAFIVVVIGGLGSIAGSAAAALIVGLAQQYANYYASSGLGDITVVLLLGLVLLVRPRGLSGAFA